MLFFERGGAGRFRLSDAFAELLEEGVAVAQIALGRHKSVSSFGVVRKGDYGMSVGAKMVDILILLAFDIDHLDAEGIGACEDMIVHLSCTLAALVVKGYVYVFAFSRDCR